VNLPWGFVITLAMTGVFIGLISSLVGLRQKAEIPLWFTWYAMWVVVVLVYRVPSPFPVILIASILAGILNGLTSSLLIKSYRKKNPWYEKQLDVSNMRVARRFLTVGPIIGAVFGAVVGGIAWGLSKAL
jgi:hypothetical protein